MQALFLYRKYFIILAACGAFACPQTKAQQISGGLEFALPNEGDALEDAVVAGFGLSARYEKSFSKNLSSLADGGFMLFTGKNRGDPILAIPVQAGVKYYLRENGPGLYGMAQLGVHSFSGGAGAHGTNFSYAPGIGYRFKKLDVVPDTKKWFQAGSVQATWASVLTIFFQESKLFRHRSLLLRISYCF